MGFNYEEIGLRLGVSRAQAYKYVQGALRTIRARTDEVADDVRTLELIRLDRLQLALWRRAVEGDETAIDRILRIMERRARMLGIDSPVSVKQESVGAFVVQGPDGKAIDVEHQFDAYLAELARLLGEPVGARADGSIPEGGELPPGFGVAGSMGADEDD